MTRRGIGLASFLLISVFVATSVDAGERQRDAAAINRDLGRGVNMGNALEAPRPGQWGMSIKPEYFRIIKEAGFDSVRIPIRWSAHSPANAPEKIDPAFFAMVDGLLKEALGNGLAVVINFHHYEELYANPEAELPRFLALWKEVATHYKGQPDTVVFELLNEPHGKLTHELWQEMFPKALAVVRESNPDRAVIIGGGSWNNVESLARLELPSSDRMLIGTFHNYNPFRFTHQGASWAPEGRNWKDIQWNGTPEERKALESNFVKAAEWSSRNDRPVYLGEFGAYQAADMPSRPLDGRHRRGGGEARILVRLLGIRRGLRCL